MGNPEEFQQITKVVCFLAIVWIVGRLCKFIKLSPLIGWIAAGLIVGPNGPRSLQLIDNNEHTPEVWKLLGTLGVTLLIAESGTHIHFDKVRKVGLKAVFIALIGTFLPLLFGFALVLLLKLGNYQAAFACGCAMAPTSVSVALKLLTEANQLNSLPGQTIVTAAFLDDVFSIILLVILKSFRPDSSPFHTILSVSSKFLFCFLFLSIGVLLAVYFWSHFIPKLLHKIPSYDNINYQPRDELHLIVMILILISYSFIGDKIGSHLLGAFIAGMSFSQVGRSMYVWRRQMKRLCGWLIKLFFACSVAFTIPTEELMQVPAFGKGLVLALFAGIIGKVMAGFVCRAQYRYIVGFAMVGRGEFAYLVAQQAKEVGLVDNDLYAIIVWALLLAVIIAPIAFGSVLQNAFRQQTRSGIKWFKIKAEAKHHTGVHFEVVDVLHNLKLDILEAKVETDGDTDCSEFIVGVGGNENLDNDKVHEILHDIREAVGDTKGQVQLLPIDEEDILPLLKVNTMEGEEMNTKEYMETVDELSKTTTIATSVDAKDINIAYAKEYDDDEVSCSGEKEYLLEIKLMSQHSPRIFAELIEEMELNSIQLLSGHLEDFLNTDSLCIFGKILNHKSNCFNIKKKLRHVLKINDISGEILVKKIRRDVAVLPHHIKFSDLLQSSNKNNPLLSNKVQNGYEIEIDIGCYDCVPHLILSLCSIFDSLDLDTRTMHVEINDNEEQQKKFLCNSTFFVQEKENNKFDQNRRYDIECRVAQIFQRRNVFASIKTKAIEIGKKSIESEYRKTVIEKVEKMQDDVENQDNYKPNDMNIEIDTKPVEMKSLAAITESVIVITPKQRSTLPPSVKKSEVTRNFIGLLDTGDRHHSIMRIPDANTPSSKRMQSESQNSSNCSSVIDILNE